MANQNMSRYLACRWRQVRREGTNRVRHRAGLHLAQLQRNWIQDTATLDSSNLRIPWYRTALHRTRHHIRYMSTENTILQL